MAVMLVRYPEEQGRLPELRRLGLPLMFLVADGTVPPVSGSNEDWIRLPVAPDELEARLAALERTATAGAETPAIDDHNVLRHRDQWVALGGVDAAVVRALLERFGEPVTRDVLIEATGAAGSGDRHNRLAVHVWRLRRRLSGLGLEIHTLRGVGYRLDEAQPATARSKG